MIGEYSLTTAINSKNVSRVKRFKYSILRANLRQICPANFDHVVNFVEEGNSFLLGASHVPRHCLGRGAQCIHHGIDFIAKIWPAGFDLKEFFVHTFLSFYDIGKYENDVSRSTSVRRIDCLVFG